MDLVFPLQTPGAKIVIDQAVGELLRLPVQTKKLNRRSGDKGEQSIWSEQASAFRNSSARITESHGSPITEDDIKARIGQRYLFCAGLEQWKVYSCLRHKAARMFKLS